MGLASTVLGTLGILAIVEGLFVVLFPKQSKSITRKLLKVNNFKKIGMIELIVGIILLLIAVWLGNY